MTPPPPTVALPASITPQLSQKGKGRLERGCGCHGLRCNTKDGEALIYDKIKRKGE